MNKFEARARIRQYFEDNHIDYKILYEGHKPVSLNEADTFYVSTHVEDVIGRHIETTLRLGDDGAYLQSYYCQKVVHDEEQAIRAARILNYINMNHEYDCSKLYEQTLILDENHGDIFVGTNIRYELLERYFDDTMYHILNYSVQVISELCVPILFYAYGKLDYADATKMIDNM